MSNSKVKCHCNACDNDFIHTFNWINALEPHEAKPITCPKCGSIDINCPELDAEAEGN